MCRVLGFSRSGWYVSCKRARPTAREIRDTELPERMREIHAASRETYGSPRVHAHLIRDGVEFGKERVARLMRADGLQGRVRRRFKATTDSKHDKRCVILVLSRTSLGYAAATLNEGGPLDEILSRSRGCYKHWSNDALWFWLGQGAESA